MYAVTIISASPMRGAVTVKIEGQLEAVQTVFRCAAQGDSVMVREVPDEVR